MANEWCAIGVPLLAMNAPPLATNAASCRLIRSSLLMLLNPQSRDRRSAGYRQMRVVGRSSARLPLACLPPVRQGFRPFLLKGCSLQTTPSAVSEKGLADAA